MAVNRSNKFHGNVPAWINLADIQIDYFTQFIRAWIPFNAWFSTSYPKENSDREILTRVKSETNPFIDRIKFLLTSSNDDSKAFLGQLGKLHSALIAQQIPSIERWITFTNITIEKNSLPSEEEWVSGKNYRYKIMVTCNHKATPGTQKINVQVLDVLAGVINPGRMNLNQNEWNLDELKTHPQFKLDKISKDKIRILIQNSIINCYKKIDPLKPIDLTVKITQRRKDLRRAALKNCIIVDDPRAIYFINEPDKVAKAIIEVFYNLRNALFHGEINPSNDVQNIYKEAYYLLFPLIKALN